MLVRGHGVKIVWWSAVSRRGGKEWRSEGRMWERVEGWMERGMEGGREG